MCGVAFRLVSIQEVGVTEMGLMVDIVDVEVVPDVDQVRLFGFGVGIFC